MGLVEKAGCYTWFSTDACKSDPKPPVHDHTSVILQDSARSYDGRSPYTAYPILLPNKCGSLPQYETLAQACFLVALEAGFFTGGSHRDIDAPEAFRLVCLHELATVHSV